MNNRNQALHDADTLDIAGHPRHRHTEPLSPNDQAARTLQTAWRQYHRASVLHRQPSLFGKTAKKTWPYDLASVIPKTFHHLLTANLPPIFSLTEHSSEHLANIMRDGVIYPKEMSQRVGISTEEDAKRFDHRLVFTHPIFDLNRIIRYNRNSIILNIEKLFQHNDLHSAYFRLYDPAANIHNVVLAVTKNINLIVFNSNAFSLGVYAELPRSSLSTKIKFIAGEHTVFHGLKNLDQFLYTFVFRLIETIDDPSIKNSIYQYFDQLQLKGKLVDHLANLIKPLLKDAELNSVNKVRLTFDAINCIQVGNRIVSTKKLKKYIQNDAADKLEFLLENIIDFVDNSYVFISGLYNFATQCLSSQCIEFLEINFEKVLALPYTYHVTQTRQTLGNTTQSIDQFNVVAPITCDTTSDISLYESHVSQNKFVIKFYSNNNHSRTELLATKLYQAAGLAAPNTLLVHKTSMATQQIGVASQYESGLLPFNKAKHEFAAGDIPGCHDGFIIDAWLANWDVVGTNYDNMYILTSSRSPLITFRLDFGGCLHFRAHGQQKPHFFNDTEVAEIKSLRNTAINRQTADIFANITETDLLIGKMRLQAIHPDIIKQHIMTSFPDNTPDIKILRHQLLQALCQRRSALLANFQIDYRNISIETMAQDIIARYIQNSTTLKLKHGAMHTCRTALYIPIFATLYRDLGYTISNEEIKLMQIAALFHDSGRQSDVGDDCAEWEYQSSQHCLQYLLTIGVEKVLASRIADSIAHKDSDIKRNKSIYRRLLQNADCLDVLRSHHWTFDFRYLNYYTDISQSSAFPTNLLHLQSLVDATADFVAKTSDLPKAWLPLQQSKRIEPTWNSAHKQVYESDKNPFVVMYRWLQQVPLLKQLYMAGTKPTHSKHGNKSPNAFLQVGEKNKSAPSSGNLRSKKRK